MVATNTFSTSAGGKRLVLVGSSIMALWRQAPRDLAPYPVLNVAVSGSTTTDWLPSGPPFNGQGFIQSRLLNVLARGDVVVYYCGSDDINVGSKAAKIANQTLAMFNMIWGKEPSTLILFVEVIMAPEKKLLGLSSVVDEVNGLIKASSTTEERIRYVPVNYLLTSDFASGNYVFDGLHLTSKGYQIIAKRVRQALQSAKEGGGRGGGASLRMMKQLTEPYPRQHIQDQTASMRKSVINHAGLEPGRRMKQLPQQLLQNELALERESTNEVEARRRSQMGGDATEEEEPQVSASAAGGISEGLKMQNKRRLRENLMGWLDLLKLEDPWLEK